jgi:hypothetical protein
MVSDFKRIIRCFLKLCEINIGEIEKLGVKEMGLLMEIISNLLKPAPNIRKLNFSKIQDIIDMFINLLSHCNFMIEQNIQLNLKKKLKMLIETIFNELLLYPAFELKNKEILLHLLCELSKIGTLRTGQKGENFLIDQNKLRKYNDLLLDLLKSSEKNSVSLFFYLSTALLIKIKK